MRNGLGLGLGAHRKVGGGGMPDWDMTFTGTQTSNYYIGWKDMPVGGNLQDLINGGFVAGDLEGVTASINATYVEFTGITAANAIRIKKTADITYLQLRGAYINWIYNGAMPASLTRLFLDSNSINWIYNGAMPAGLDYLYLYGHSINWTWDGALPAGLYYLYLNGSYINWTGNKIGDIEKPPNMTNVGLLNFISPTGATMTVAQFSGIIISLAYNVGKLPATVTINELPDMTHDGVNAVDWGEMVGDSFVPSELAVALKTVVITKEGVINLSAAGLAMPIESGDGVGFPEGFGDWWRVAE